MPDTMDRDEVTRFAYEIVESRGEVPRELTVAAAQFLVSEDDAWQELFAAQAAMEMDEFADANLADAAWVAAYVIVLRAEGRERSLVADY